METVVVNKYKDDFDVYIGRGSPWGNPYVIGEDGTRDQVIQLYKDLFFKKIQNGDIAHADLLNLKGKRLGCFCSPQNCHGDIIAEYVNNMRLPVRLIVAGSRNFTDYDKLCKSLDYLLSNTDKEEVTILCGMAKGADLLGRRYADENNIDVREYPADWDKYGKSAGYLRNSDMADNATHLVAFWDGVSKGTKHMIDLARKKGLVIRVIRY